MTETTATPEPTSPAPSPRANPKWLEAARADVKRLKGFASHAERMAERDANETDTRLLVTDILTDVLGWDKYADLSTEYQVRGEFADYALRVDGQLFAMVEVKRAAQKLNERHLRQIESYGLREGVDWLVLTNARTWRVYRLCQQEQGTKPELMFEVGLDDLGKNQLEDFMCLHKQTVKRGMIEDRWKQVSALAKGSVDHVLMSDRVLHAVRLEVKSQTGYNASPEEVKAALLARLEG